MNTIYNLMCCYHYYDGYKKHIKRIYVYKQVLKLLDKGTSEKEIARKLCLPPTTVHNIAYDKEKYYLTIKKLEKRVREFEKWCQEHNHEDWLM